MEAVRIILRLGRATWRAFAFFGTLIGILYLWPDIQGLDEVYPWFRLWAPSRESLLIAFAIVCVLYIAWIDFRPYVNSFRSGSLKPFAAKGVNGKVIDWVDAAGAMIRAAEKGKTLEFAAGRDLKKRDQLNWCLMIIQSLSKEGSLPIFVREKGGIEWEPLSVHEHSYHVHDTARTLFRFHDHPWENDAERELFDFDSVVVRLRDLERILRMYRNGKITSHPIFNPSPSPASD